MSQHLPYIPLESVVNDYLAEAEYSNHKFFKIWHIAFRGLEDMGMDAFYQIKSVKLPINGNLTVPLPADYLNFTKVGVLNEQGEIIPLYYNDKLTTYADLNSNRIEKTQDGDLVNNFADWGLNSWFNYFDGYVYTNIYGVPSGQPFMGNFKVDTNNGVILLNETFRFQYLMLEYVASPREGEEYYLPVQFREALISWIRWKDAISTNVKTHVQNSSIGMRRKDYYNDRRLAIAKWKPIRKEEAYQASQEQTRLAIKS
jgi:hypothetical protein